jgi:hypothetical protein
MCFSKLDGYNLSVVLPLLELDINLKLVQNIKLVEVYRGWNRERSKT